ncbi:MAG: hypothetical protein Q9212_002646 [Teloschistes hypoglaucus]
MSQQKQDRETRPPESRASAVSNDQAISAPSSPVVRKSPRLQEQQRLRGSSAKSEPVRQLPSPTSNSPGKQATASADRKRKREHERSVDCQDAAFLTIHQAEPDQKRHRTQLTDCAISNTLQPDSSIEPANSDSPLTHWIKEGTWPTEYFHQDGDMIQSLTRKRSIRSQNTDQTSTPSNSTGTKAGRNTDVRNKSYEILLQTAGIYMSRKVGIEDPPTDGCRLLFRTFLDTEQNVPEDSLFNDDLFEDFCLWISDRNEATIVRDLTPLLVPSAELMNLRGARHLRHVIEAVDESWSKFVPMINSSCPKPDFSVGLRISAFTPEQQVKLRPFDGGLDIQSRLMATHQMYFPFLTAEAKCGQEGITVADRQNAHSASVAVNALVELYKTVSRQKELHRKILVFSISHNHNSVDIYGHYALIDDKKITFHRYLVKSVSFADPDGRDKWRPYKFTKNVYDSFLPIHLARVCSAVDQLPDPAAFDPDPLSEPSTTGDPTQGDGQGPGTSSATTPQTSAEPASKKPKARED